MFKNIYFIILIFLSQKSFGSFDSYLVQDKKTKSIKVVKDLPSNFLNTGDFVEPNFIVELDISNINQSKPKEGWHLQKIGMTSNILKSSNNTKPLIVAVIDSGMDWSHPDLKNHLYTNEQEIPDNGIDDDGNGFIDDVHGFNFIENNGNSIDDNGHGTHVSGIIAGDCNQKYNTCGLMKNVKILPLKFLSKEGRGDTASAIAAINYAIKMKVDIINASWGSEDSSDLLKSAIKKASDQGILFVTASGNYKSNNDQVPMYPANFPLDNIISVAATDEFDVLDEFSNFGPKTVHVAAPGKNILSTYLNGQYESLSGTSMATPIVTGVVGLLKQYHLKSSMADIKSALINSCTVSDSLADKVICKGRVSLNKTLGEYNSLKLH